jgi:hypothetical protein
MLRRIAASMRRAAPLAVLWGVVIVYYVFVVSAGHFTRWDGWSALYGAQAEGLLRGHLYLPEAPPRALMALENPYDIANMRYWRWDHSYYQGHLYLYWGLAPAFLAAAVRLLFGVPGVADNGLVFAFFVLRLVAGTLLIRDVARTAARRPARWVVALAMLVFALASPTPYTLARGAIYEAAIMGGAAFMVAGLYLGRRAMTASSDGDATGWLAGASLAFGLAAASRPNLFPMIIVVAALAGFWRWRQGETASKRRLVASSAAALLPVSAIMFAHLIMNHARFGDWTEFGRHYQLTYPTLDPGLRFVVPDSYAYLLAPPQVSCAFPFLQSRWDMLHVSMPAWLASVWPVDHYGREPVAGLLIAAPFCWFALVAPLFVVARARLRSVAGTATGATSNRWGALFAARGNWLWAAMLLYVAGSAPLLVLKVTTMRYEQDFASGLLLIAIFGAWRLLAAPNRPGPRRALAWLYGALAVSTIVAGVLLGFTGYFRHFEQHNPDLYDLLRDTLSVCPNRSASWLH